MHVKGFLHKTLSSVMHKKRLDTLSIIVHGLLIWKRLSVTELGRGMAVPIQERSAIRRADRFIGNLKLHSETNKICAIFITLLIHQKRRPNLIVDWSQIPNTKNHVLRAALVAPGRALTLYEEVYPEKKLGNSAIEKKFLRKLAKLLPTECKPIIITDAGFRNPWFKQVVELGWDYVGRIRGTHQYFDGKSWLKCKDLLSRATSKAKSIGEVVLCKKNPIVSNLYLLKEKSKKKSLKTKKTKPTQKKGSSKKKRGGKNSLEYSRSATEGWLLASSLPGKNWLTIKRVIKIYKKRMQIEEGFRDLKSSKYGFGFEKAYSRDIRRIGVLLLVAMIASIIAWLVGYAAEQRKWQYQFQVNSIKTRRVLSLFYLGCQILRRGLKITTDIFEEAVHGLWRTQ
jgi:hypothetical protein